MGLILGRALLYLMNKRRFIMLNAGEIVKKFYAAVIKKDIAAARGYLNDDLLFLGLFETYHSAEEYIAALTKLLQVVVRLDVKKIIAEENDAAVFFELETKAPGEATTLVAEWHQVKNGKITRVESAFDGRPFVAMFAGGKRS
jgi:ketosteroid isomerase-like protein